MLAETMHYFAYISKLFQLTLDPPPGSGFREMVTLNYVVNSVEL